jgi:hypothetical protein
MNHPLVKRNNLQKKRGLHIHILQTFCNTYASEVKSQQSFCFYHTINPNQHQRNQHPSSQSNTHSPISGLPPVDFIHEIFQTS